MTRARGRPSLSEANDRYLDEIVAKLVEMEVGDNRVVPKPLPETLSLSNMKNRLRARGWYEGMHYKVGRLPGEPRPSPFIYIIKMGWSIAGTKIALERDNTLTPCENHSSLDTPPWSAQMNNSHDKPEKIVHENDAANHQRLLNLMYQNNMNANDVAALTGYSVATIYGFTMPDRSSQRAGNVTDRFMELFTLKLQANGLKTD